MSAADNPSAETAVVKVPKTVVLPADQPERMSGPAIPCALACAENQSSAVRSSRVIRVRLASGASV